MSRAALITGASRGIGRAVAIRLAREMPVVVNFLNDEDSARQVADVIRSAGGRAMCIRANVADVTDVRAMSDCIRSDGLWVQTLINNAGITRDSPVSMMTSSAWREVIDCNLGGVFNCIKEFTPTMISRKGGVIVNMSSVSGLHGQIGQANYSASKAGIVGMTKALAKELGRYRIRVNCVAPGFIDTDMVSALLTNDRLKGKVEFAINELTPLARIGTPEEVAAVVAFLASEESRYMTGQTLEVDGGLAL